jgi:hypothetical protein
MLKALRELAEGYIFDPSLIDLVVWFPHLSWSELAAATAVVLAWRWVADRIEQAAVRRTRRLLSALLLRAAIALRPRSDERQCRQRTAPAPVGV